jgi:hypothetical protein
MVTDEGRSTTQILAEWRATERELLKAIEGSLEYDILAARVHDLARAYQASTDQAAEPPFRGENPLAATGNA